MKTLKTLTGLAACLWLMSAHTHAQRNVAAFSDYYNGKRYDFVITQERLNQTPSWPASAEYPPLSPRKAMAVALAYLPALVKGADKWHRGAVTLQQVGEGEKWVYVVGFVGNHAPGIIDGPVPSMRVVVLMDGQSVEPVISDHKLSQRTAPTAKQSRKRSGNDPTSRYI